MKVLIVDDENKARSLLRNCITDHCKGLEIVAEAESVKEAVKLINKHQPDIVFLDIEMPVDNGFALFDYFDQPPFETIFCTAYSEFALRAFEVSAIDYILKPINISKLQHAVEKAIKQSGQNKIVNQINVLKDNMTNKQLQKIGLTTNDGLVFLQLNDVLYFEADGSYTKVFIADKHHLVSKRLKDFEELLDNDTRFFRVHRSFLINVNQIDKYCKKEGAALTFANNVTIPVAREKKVAFDDFVGNISV